MISFGKKKQILVVGNDGLQLYVLKGKTVSLYADFSNTIQDLKTELKHAFKANSGALTVLFDVVEQQYRRETIPKVGFLDKAKVVQRKLTMAFPQQQMRAFLELKQKPAGNEGFVALFAGLSSSEVIDQIFAAVTESEVAINGIGLLPLESTNLVAQLSKLIHDKFKTPNTSRWSILITHHKTGGLRQIVTKDGELALTRMTPLVIDDAYETSLPSEIAREFNATLTYLSRFGYVAGDGLDLYVISTAETSERLKNYTLPVNNFYALSANEALNLLGLSSVSARDAVTYGEILHAGWTGGQNKLAVPLSASFFDKVKMARQVARIAILGLMISAAYFSWQIIALQGSTLTFKNDISQQQVQTKKLQAKLDEMTRQMGVLEQLPEKTKVILEKFDEYTQKSMDIDPTLTVLIETLNGEGLLLKDLEITKEADTASNTPASAPAAPMVRPGGRMPGGMVGSPMMMDQAPPAEPVVVKKPSVTMKMTITFPNNTTIESAARKTISLAEKLKEKFPNRTVTVDQMVGDLSIDKTVQGSSEQVSQNRVEGRLVKDETSTLVFKGEVQ
jgi:hypothetical protein